MTPHPLSKAAVEAGAKTVFEAADKVSNGATSQNTWENVSQEIRDWATERATEVISAAFEQSRLEGAALSVDGGYVMVPREPTQEMLAAMPSLPAIQLPVPEGEKHLRPAEAMNLVRYRAMIAHVLATSPSPAKVDGGMVAKEALLKIQKLPYEKYKNGKYKKLTLSMIGKMVVIARAAIAELEKKPEEGQYDIDPNTPPDEPEQELEDFPLEGR